MNAFEILGIEPTQDKKTIKKAYAALVKKYHPEEEMQKWQEIHEAYQNALEWAEGRNYLTKAAASGGIPEENTDEVFRQQISRPIKETGTLSAEADEPEEAGSKEREEAELNNLFDNLGELTAALKTEKIEQEKRKLQRALAELDQMERYHKLGYEDWKELFSGEEYQQAMSQSAFLNRWSEILEKLTIDKKLYQLMVGKLKSIAQNQGGNEQAAETVGMMEPVELTEMKIRAAYNRYRGKQKKKYKIVATAILILTSVIKIHERKEDREWKKHMQDSINYEYNLRQGNEEWINDNKKGLNTVSDFDLLEAELSLDNLAKFLMRADEEIVSIVLPYTQTLKPGILVLSEEFKFKVKKVLQAGKPEKAGSAGNEYELVPLSLPDTNQILVGEESVDLTKDTIEFAVRTENFYDSVLLWIDPKEMGFEKGCEIYCFDGEDYQKAGRRVSGDGEQAEIYFYDVLTYQVLCIRVSRLGEEEYPVVLIPVE
ncbi:MAG: J domain-containing protein [Lachnospiraceae bacterium]|nr:J domain-containing protein [Lachnospiraceae bacterium]